MDPSESVLRHNLDYVDTLYRKWLEDPASVPASWSAFFEGYHLGLRHGEEDALAALPAAPADGADREAPIYLTDAGAVPEGVDRSTVTPALRVYDLVHGYRTYGHLLAAIDPLGLSERTHPLLDLDQFGLTAADFDHPVRCENFKAFREGTIGEFLTALQETYCASVGVEYMDVLDKDSRDWMQEQLEPARSRWRGSVEQRRALLRELVFCDAFEEGLHRMYVGQKRFSLEGATTLVPLLRRLIEEFGKSGGEQVVIGMAHRGRLNVLAHVLNKRYEYILAEFEGRPLAAAMQGYGDVKYHLGYSTDYGTIAGKRVHVSMAFNPSHLETVNPVVEGIVRAKQNVLGDSERRRVVPVLVHGDAAFAGQGVVAETFMLAGLAGYNTGGTVHVIVNNQVGFTTDPGDSRSTQYCSDLAKTTRAPVFHVNADDAEAVIYVIDLALQYRQRFQRDVVIDLVCYRRYGHNEIDDPTFTQPLMYERVKAHASNSRVYEAQLRAEGVVDDAVVDGFRREVARRLEEAQAAAKGMTAQYVEQLGGVWKGLRTAGHDWSADTRVPRETLDEVARSFVAAPEDFKWHGRLKKLMKKRSARVLEDGEIDWGCGEMLAFGSLVMEGTKVRLTGQDSIRGTFSHRHAAYFDQAIDLCREAGFRRVLLRGDTDYSQTQHLDRWDSDGVRFLFGMPRSQALFDKIREIPERDWRKLRRPAKYEVETEPRSRPERTKDEVVKRRLFKTKRTEAELVASFEYQPTACSKPYRIIVLTKNLSWMRGEEMLCDDLMHFFYITNDWKSSPSELVLLANGRCDQENINAQLKSGGVRAMQMPLGDLVSNWAYMVMAALAWTLKAWFALLLPTHGRWRHEHRAEQHAVLRMEFRSFLLNFMLVPVQIVRTGRRLVYRLLAWNPWQSVLLRAATALRC